MIDDRESEEKRTWQELETGRTSDDYDYDYDYEIILFRHKNKNNTSYKPRYK